MRKSLCKFFVIPPGKGYNFPKRKGTYIVKPYNLGCEVKIKFDPTSKSSIEYWTSFVQYYWCNVYQNIIHSEKRKLNAILIDPNTKLVSTIQTNGEFRDVCELLGCKTLIGLPNYFILGGDLIFTDEDSWGHFKKEDCKVGFTFIDWDYLFLGKSLILGENPDNYDSVTCVTNLEDIKDKIIWLDSKAILKQGKLKKIL
jgi:hypothetical protein